MMFSHYKETCEVLLDYLKIGGDDIIEDYSKKALKNLLHANIYVHSRIFSTSVKVIQKCVHQLILRITVSY